MRIHSLHSFGAIVLFLGHSILSSCSDNALDNVMEYDFSQLNALIEKHLRPYRSYSFTPIK